MILAAQDSDKKKDALQQEEDKLYQRRFRGMVVAGFSMSQIDGDRMAGYYKFGFNGGVGAYAMIKKRFSISMELLYSMRGAKSQLNNAKVSSRTISLDYLDVPIMFNYHDRKIAIFGAGFQVGALVRRKQTVYDSQGMQLSTLTYSVGGNERTVAIDEYNANYRALDLQVVGHATFLIKKRIGIQGRFGYSILGMGKQKFDDGNLANKQQRSNVLSLRVFYMF